MELSRLPTSMVATLVAGLVLGASLIGPVRATAAEPAWSPVVTLSGPGPGSSHGHRLDVSGDYGIVVWATSGSSEANDDLWVRTRNADGWLPAQLIGTGLEPEVAVNASGDAAVVWRRSTPAARPGPVMVSTGTAGEPWASTPVKLAPASATVFADDWAVEVSDSGAAIAWWGVFGFAHVGPIRAWLNVSYRPPGGEWRSPVNVTGVRGGIQGDATIGPAGSMVVSRCN